MMRHYAVLNQSECANLYDHRKNYTNKYIENSQHFGKNSGILWILNMGATHQVIISLPLDRYLF